MSQPGPPATKRQRIGRACGPCRKRKSKCGGESPACLVCLSTSRICFYDDNSRKRGLLPGYVRSLETLLGMYIREAPENEQKLRALLRYPKVRCNLLESDSTEGASEGASEGWRQSRLCKDLELLLTSPEDAPEACFDATDDQNHQLNDSSATINDGQQPALGTTGADMHNGSRDVCCGKLPAETQDLVDFYFIHTHCWFPIVERRDILRTMHSESPLGDLGSSDKGLRACLWAIIALSLAQQRQPSEDIPTFEQIQAHLRSQIAEHDREPELGHIQAILITSLLRIGWGHFQTAWTLVGGAIRMLLVCKKRPARYDHTCRGCLMLDVFLSALLGRRSYFPSDAEFSLGQLDEDSLDEWELWSQLTSRTGDGNAKRKDPLRALSSFTLVLQLTQRVNRIIWHPIEDTHHHTLIDDLVSWKTNLPGHRKLRDPQHMNPPQLNLHLMWNFVMCTLLGKATSVDTPLVKLAEQTAGSTLEILQKYQCCIGAVTPLLEGFALQARNCLQTLSQIQPLNTTLSCIMRLGEAQHNLRQQWRADDKSHAEASNVKSLERSVSTPAAQQTFVSFPDAISSAGNTTQSLTMPSDAVGSALPGTQSTAPLSLTSEIGPDFEGTAVSGEDQFSDTNDFDALFGEVSSYMTVKRPNLQSDFAHNLGFVTDDFDSDFFAFLHGGKGLT